MPVLNGAGAPHALFAHSRQKRAGETAARYLYRGRDIGQRLQHERALVHARMGNDQTWRANPPRAV